MSKLIKMCFLIAVFVLALGTVVLAQGYISPELISVAAEAGDVPEEVIIDEMVNPDDLGVEEPTLLPDSKFYFLKNWKRGIESLFTFDKVKKAELKLKYASEKLLEARKLADKNKRPEILTKAAENFQEEMEKVKKEVDKIKDTAGTNPKVGKFLDKFVQHQILHQKILDKLIEKVPEGALEKITQIKERHLEKFGQVMEKLEDKEQIKSRIENNLQNMKGSQFKQVKEMEILKRFEEHSTENMKENIMQAREAVLIKFKGTIEEMPAEIRDKFGSYIETMKGESEKKMEILEDIKTKIQLKPDIKAGLEAVQVKIIQKTNTQSESQGLRCRTSEIVPKDCKGRIIIEKDIRDCPVPICIEVTEPVETEEKPTACITLWEPVCGANGKTYGNACKAESAGVEIRYEGVCRQELMRNRILK